MAWAERGPNGLWRGLWRDAEGHRGWTEFAYLTKRQAQAEAWQREQQARGPGSLHRVAAPGTWGEWRDTWLALREREVAASTFAGNQVWVRRYLTPRWGETRWIHLSRGAIQDWIDELVGDEVGSSTILKVVWLFSASLSAAVDRGYLAANPCRDLRLPRDDSAHERFFTPEEIAAIMDWMNHPYSTAVLLLVETGLRIGELAGLHWQHVDVLHRRLDIRVGWSPEGNAMGPAKGRKRRAAPLSSRAVEILDALPHLEGRCGQRHDGTAPCRSGLVLPSPEGLPLNPHRLRERHWYPALDLAGLGEGTVHDLRHTFASWAAQAGVPLSDIAEAMGHSDSYVTRRYAHLAGTHVDRIADAFDAMRRTPGTVTPLRPDGPNVGREGKL